MIVKPSKTCVIMEESILIVTETASDAADVRNIESAAKWGKFLAIIQFVMLSLGAACVLFMLLGMGVAGMALPGMTQAIATTALWMFIFALAIILVCFIPAFYLLRFAQKTKTAVDTNDQSAMTESLRHLRSYMKTTGIIYIASLAFGILVMIGGIIAGVLSVI